MRVKTDDEMRYNRTTEIRFDNMVCLELIRSLAVATQGHGH